MSTTTPPLRPPRTTPNLQLPVPGDANAADYVTDTGAICDQLDTAVPQASQDAVAAERASYITPSQLDPQQIGPFFNGRIVDMVVDPGNYIVWRLRYVAPSGVTPAWAFVGGTPLYAQTNAPAATYQASAWQGGFAPALTAPRGGAYRVLLSTVVQSTQAALTSLWIAVNRSSAPNTPQALTVNVSPVTNQSMMATLGGILPLNANEQVQVALYNSLVVNILARYMTLVPVWVN